MLDQTLPILTYHRVHLDADVTIPADLGRVNLSEFEKQMRYLAEAGCRTVTHREIAAWLLDGASLPQRAVAIDFDDNRRNVLDNAFPVMREYGFVGTVFTVTDLADAKPLPEMDHIPAMHWAQLLQLRDAGWCIAPHTCTHRFLTEIPLDEARHEMAASYDRVREMTGEDAAYFAYPGGYWNDDLEAFARQLFKTARHWHLQDAPKVTANGDPHRLPGVNVAMDMTMQRFGSICG